MRTRITDLLGIRYPIVLAGMGFVSDVRLTVAVSNAGGLGILETSSVTSDELRENIRQVRAKTDKPFGANLMAGNPRVNELAKVIVEEKVPIISHGRGNPEWLFKAAKEYGGIVMPTIGALRHALKVERSGADAIVVQGAEGGGHTGYIASTVLLPLITSRVKMPVLAAGSSRTV